MVDGHLFDMLSSIAQSLRKKTERPFGGIQVRGNRAQICGVGVTCKSLVGYYGRFFPIASGN